MAKSHPCVLVFDIGTQSTRTLLIDEKGDILAKRQKVHEPAYTSPVPDWAEQEASYYFDCMCSCARQMKSDFPELWDEIQGVSVTCIRDTVVCLGEDGIPLRPAILWLDKRKAQGTAVISTLAKMAIKAVGMEDTVNLQYAKSHCNWLREEEPETWKKTKHFVLLSAYLVSRLVGQVIDAVPSIVGHVPFDYKNRSWQVKGALTRPVFPVEPEKLCPLKEGGEELGRITPRASQETGLKEGLPVIATGSDKACELLGLGCVDERTVGIALGTTATVSFTVNRYLEPERFIPPFPSILPGHWTPEIEIFRGYWLISWFKKEFAAKEVVQAKALGIPAEVLLNRRLQEIPAGCDGLLFQPYFTPNITMPNARGAMIGFSDIHSRIHVYRAIIEGINFALYEGLKGMEKKTGKHFSLIRVGGGGSQSDEICQITANMFGIPVERVHTYEVAGLGSAIATWVGLGRYTSFQEAVQAMVRPGAVFEVKPEEHEVYQRLYQTVYHDIYPSLKPIYDRLSRLRERGEGG